MMNNTLHMKLLLSSTALLVMLTHNSFASGLELKPISDLSTSFKLAKVCFLPDCGDNAGDVEIDINIESKKCEDLGYYRTCPNQTAPTGKTCDYDETYNQCSKAAWCIANNFKLSTCSKPQYLTGQCDNLEPFYKSCTTDNARACTEVGYTQTCASGQKLYADQRCAWDTSFGKCCTPKACPANTSLSGTFGDSGVNDGCGYACKYTCNTACPSGTSETNPGGCGGSTTNPCGNKSCYYPYQACCGSQYRYNASNCKFPNKLAGGICGGLYSDCILDENNINCDNYTLPNTANYIKTVYTCDDLYSAVNSKQTGNIIIMKSLKCPRTLTLSTGQNLVGIGYFEDTNSTLYKNQLNQCSILQLDNYLYTSGANKISDITLNNTPLYLRGATDMKNMNIKIASNYTYAIQGATSPASVMNGIINIFTPGSIALSNVNMTLNNTRLNLRPTGGTNRGFYRSDITANGDTIINMDLSGASGIGEAVYQGKLYLNDNTILNIKTSGQNIEGFNGGSDGSDPVDGNYDNGYAYLYINSSNIVIRTITTSSFAFVWGPRVQYVTGASIMTTSGLYKAGKNGTNQFKGSRDDMGTNIPTNWTKMESPDYSASSEFGKAMEIFDLNFFK